MVKITVTKFSLTEQTFWPILALIATTELPRLPKLLRVILQQSRNIFVIQPFADLAAIITHLYLYALHAMARFTITKIIWTTPTAEETRDNDHNF